MKRSYKKPRVKKVKVPRPVPPPKLERPKRGDLKRIYKDLITTDQAQRINTLSRALAWYDQVYGYLVNNNKWKIKQYRTLNNAEASRFKGINAKTNDSKEQHFIQAIKHYQAMFSSYKPSKIVPFLRKLKSSKGSLVAHKRSMQKKHGKFLQLITEALAPQSFFGEPVKLNVDKLSAPYRIGSDSNVTIDRKMIVNLRRLTRKHGLLSAVEQLLPVLSEVGSSVPETDNEGLKTGRYKINYKLRYAVVLNLIHSLNQYAQKVNAVRSIVRRHKAVSKTTTP